MKHTSRFLLPLLTLCLATSLQASVLMLDFGPTAAIDDAGADNSLLNSPYHTVNTSFTDTTWNQVQTADIAAGSLMWSDGTTASGVSLNIGGNSGAGVTTIDLAKTGLTSDALGGSNASGIYAGTSVGTDAIFLGTSGARAVGFQITGLAAGTYDIYITARNTNTSSAQTQGLYVGTAASGSGNFDFSGYSNKTLTYASNATATSGWSEDANYVHFSVSISSGEVLNLASYAPARGFLNSVQIVSAIPEPSTYASFAGIGALALCIGSRIRVSRAL
jgi:hypothetical protein